MEEVFENEYLDGLQKLVGKTNGVHADTKSFLPLIKSSLRELQEYRARWQKAIKYSPIGIAIVSEDGYWVEVNLAACHILGRSETELKTLRWQDVTHPDDIEEDQTLVDLTAIGDIGSYNMKKRYILPDGTIKNVLLSVSKIDEDNGHYYFISQIVDLDWGNKVASLDKFITRKEQDG